MKKKLNNNNLNFILFYKIMINNLIRILKNIMEY